MANNPSILVEERSRDIGNFMVGRLLPFRHKRQVGPFTFIDHMGPATLAAGKYMDVDQHPHIGLSTLTYLLEGSVEHRDSTGAFQVITPGDVGFMTAGKGVSHTERTPANLRLQEPIKMHGYQVWVALPKSHELMDPSFQYVPAEDLPKWHKGGLTLKLIAGRGYGRVSPLQVFSDLFMLDVKASRDQELSIKYELKGEIAIVVTEGEVTAGEENIAQGQMLVSKTEDQCQLHVKAGTKLLLFGGEPLPEERYLYWNFVSSDKQLLEQAKQNWKNKRFPKVEGDETYIPLPGL